MIVEVHGAAHALLFRGLGRLGGAQRVQPGGIGFRFRGDRTHCEFPSGVNGLGSQPPAQNSRNAGHGDAGGPTPDARPIVDAEPLPLVVGDRAVGIGHTQCGEQVGRSVARALRADGDSALGDGRSVPRGRIGHGPVEGGVGRQVRPIRQGSAGRRVSARRGTLHRQHPRLVALAGVARHLRAGEHPDAENQQASPGLCARAVMPGGATRAAYIDEPVMTKP